ncbi:MAG: hypothetical protein Q9M92_04240 [Enterobacterales bacterium]|nr:hypothetical protein [Enterobacterales bacterium]
MSAPFYVKIFFIAPYQVYQARLFGADAILLMLSVLDDDDYRQLAKVAAELHLDVLTEVHDQNELNRALKLNAAIIGINNRNLKDLSINLQTTKQLMDLLTTEQRQKHIFISESGIDDYSQVKSLASIPNGVDGFLVGSSIMSKPDISAQCKLLYMVE